MGRQPCRFPPRPTSSCSMWPLSLTKSPKSLRILCAIFVNMFPAQRFALCLAQPRCSCALIWHTQTHTHHIFHYIVYGTGRSISSAIQHYQPAARCPCCQFSVEFFETPWMILAESRSPLRVFCVFTQLLYREPVASSQATIHLRASIPISAQPTRSLA